MPPDTTLADAPAALLAAVVAAIEAPPERQYVSTGEPAWDCAQVVAWWERVRPTGGGTTTDLGNQRYRVVPVLDLAVAVLRDATAFDPGGAAPDDAVLLAESAKLAQDAWDTWRDVVPAVQAGTLWPGIARGASVTFGVLSPLAPSGELAGWAWRLAVQLAPARTPTA